MKNEGDGAGKKAGRGEGKGDAEYRVKPWGSMRAGAAAGKGKPCQWANTENLSAMPRLTSL